MEVCRSSESPSNLFSNTELAKELLQIVSGSDARLIKLLSKSEKTELADEHKKITQAIASALYDRASGGVDWAVDAAKALLWHSKPTDTKWSRFL